MEEWFRHKWREQQYVHMKRQPKNEKYVNGSVGARVRLMVRGGCLPVREEWKYADDLCGVAPL